MVYPTISKQSLKTTFRIKERVKRPKSIITPWVQRPNSTRHRNMPAPPTTVAPDLIGTKNTMMSHLHTSSILPNTLVWNSKIELWRTLLASIPTLTAMCKTAVLYVKRGRSRDEWSATWRGGFLLTSRTICALWTNGSRVRKGDEVRQLHLDLAPGGTPSWRIDHRVCLGVGRPPKTPLNDVQPERGED
jgi:hypothetical protein